jgi:hypothetical protein
MESENCIMCQKPIGKEVNQWALQIRPSIWIHYHCLENLWSSFNATPFQKQLRAERDALRAENERLREALRAIAELDLNNYVLWYESASKWMKNRAKIALEETK